MEHSVTFKKWRKMNNKEKRSINWLNMLFILLTAAVAVIATPWIIVMGWVKGPTWILAAVMMMLTGLSITAGYHRLCAHKSYQASWPVRLLLALFGAAAFQGSIMEWCTDHRTHHRYTDTEDDPYNIKQGFWHAHITWLFFLDPTKRNFSNVEDLQSDPIYSFQHRFYPLLAVMMSFVLPTIIGALWGNAISALIIAGLLRVTVVYQMTFFINSLCHLVGKQTYKSSSARDNWVTALVTFGEGFHNFHHQFPIDYRNGLRFFHFDPTKWLIYALAKLGLASDLKRIDTHRVIKYRIQTESQRFKHTSEELIKSVYTRIDHLLTHLEKLEQDYNRMKQMKLKKYRTTIAETKSRLKATHKELKAYLAIWDTLLAVNT